MTDELSSRLIALRDQWLAAAKQHRHSAEVTSELNPGSHYPKTDRALAHAFEHCAKGLDGLLTALPRQLAEKEADTEKT